ncbi:MAG: efflux RND transporter periplasmic adaptor subunit [Bacteroidales bacterium]|jgi:membrane fusion protein (multidrug efflux system)
MKTAQKYLLYLSIPILLLVAFLIYNSFFRKTEIGSFPEGGIKTKKDNNRERSGGARSLPVSVYIADYYQAEDGLMRTGTLVARERVEMASELSGRVVNINFKDGQFVKKGDILVRLNDDELQAQLRRAEYQYTLLEEKLGRQKILLSKEAVSREDYDQVSTEFNVLKQDIEQLKIKIEKMKITAPFDGVIGFRSISLGAMLMQNSKIATIVDAANLILEFSIPEKYITNNIIGTKADFTLEGISKTYSALVYAIDPEIDVKTRTVMLRARVYNSDGLLKPGRFVKVMLNTKGGGLKIFLPNQAVVPNVKGRSVWIVRNGTAVMTSIQTGTRTADMMEVLSGVEKGDTIITTGLMQLREGITVTPTNI